MASGKSRKRKARARAADDWLGGGWRNDPPEEVTLGRILLMTAKGSSAARACDSALVRLARANLYRKVAPKIEALRAEQRRLLYDRRHRRSAFDLD